MKTSVVPAQITSVEDTITANLSLTQIILLIIPVFMAAIIFAGLPPLMHVKLYKLVLLVILSAPIVTLALRMQGQLVLKWLVLLAGYRLRARRYLFTEASAPCDCDRRETEPEPESETIDARLPRPRSITIAPAQQVALIERLNGQPVTFYTSNTGQLNAVIESE